MGIDVKYAFMANVSWLEEAAFLHDEHISNGKKRSILLTFEEAKNLATRSELLFKDDVGRTASRFVTAYGELLESMYKYNLILARMDSYNKEKPCTIVEASKATGEPAFREDLCSSISALEQAYVVFVQKGLYDKARKKIKLA